ncbi:hypothetical protein D3C87_1431680 [compost metagenome]
MGVGHAQEVALIHCTNADATGDRGADLRVGQLHLGGINRSLIALGGGLELVDQCLLLVVGLFGDAVVDAQQFVALEVDQCDLQLRLAFAELCLGLIETGADRAVVDGGQQVAFFHQLAFLDHDFGEDAVDLRADDDAVQGQDRADAADEAGDVFFGDADHAYGNGGGRGEFCLGGFGGVPQAQRCQDDQEGDEQGGFLLDSHASGAPGLVFGRKVFSFINLFGGREGDC